MKSKIVLIEINYSIPIQMKCSYTSIMLRDHAWQVNSLLQKLTLCKKQLRKEHRMAPFSA